MKKRIIGIHLAALGLSFSFAAIIHFRIIPQLGIKVDTLIPLFLLGLITFFLAEAFEILHEFYGSSTKVNGEKIE